MERRLGLLVALAITGAGCAADDGGGSTVNTRDPVTMDDGGVNGGGNGSGNGGSNGSANGANGANGASGGGSNGSNGPEICEAVTVRADKVIPDILIVLDKSGSMVWPGCAAAGNPTQIGCPNNPTPPYDAPYDRWVPSVAALKTTTAALETRVRFGLMVFPSPDIPSSFPILIPPTACQPGTMRVQPGLNTSAAIAAELDSETPDGSSTPIPGTLKAAHAALGTALVGPDAAPTPKYVLFVTDGEPTCTVAGTGVTINQVEQVKNESYAEIDSLTKDGIKTFVVGYDTSKTANLATTLDEMARRGGTGETKHREVTDENSLLAAVEAIAGQITTCTFQLDQAPPDVNKIRVTLDGVDRANGDGWELTGDRTIELRGEACAQIQDISIQHTLSINVECKDVIIQ